MLGLFGMSNLFQSVLDGTVIVLSLCNSMRDSEKAGRGLVKLSNNNAVLIALSLPFCRIFSSFSSGVLWNRPLRIVTGRGDQRQSPGMWQFRSFDGVHTSCFVIGWLCCLDSGVCVQVCAGRQCVGWI